MSLVHEGWTVLPREEDHTFYSYSASTSTSLIDVIAVTPVLAELCTSVSATDVQQNGHRVLHMHLLQDIGPCARWEIDFRKDVSQQSVHKDPTDIWQKFESDLKACVQNADFEELWKLWQQAAMLELGYNVTEKDLSSEPRFRKRDVVKLSNTVQRINPVAYRFVFVFCQPR